MVVEVFVSAPGVRDMVVSNLGTVMSHRRGWREVGFTDTKGYRSVQADGKRLAVHRLVALAFHGEPPPGTHLVRHLNGVKLDNRSENLAWGTSAENAEDSLRLGEFRSGPEHHNWRIVCAGGHSLSGENVYVTGGRRRCRTCDRATWTRYRERRRQGLRRCNNV